MDEGQRSELAESRAEGYAPRPTGGAIMAGVSGASLALLAAVTASRFYGWLLRDHLWVGAMTMVSGFAVGWVGYIRLARVNRKARRVERAQIDDEQDGAGRAS